MDSFRMGSFRKVTKGTAEENQDINFSLLSIAQKIESNNDSIEKNAKDIESLQNKKETTVSVSVEETITGNPGTPANVENLGDNVDVKLKFTIPQGIQGLQGEQGFSVVKSDEFPLEKTREQWNEIIVNGLFEPMFGLNFRIGDIAIVDGVVTDENNLKVQLYGTVVDRSGQLLKLKDCYLIESGANGERGFSVVHNNAPALKNTREQWNNALSRPSNLWSCPNPKDFKVGDIMQLYGEISDENKSLVCFGIVIQIDSNGNLKTEKNFLIEDGDRGPSGGLTFDDIYPVGSFVAALPQSDGVDILPGENIPGVEWKDIEFLPEYAYLKDKFLRVGGGSLSAEYKLGVDQAESLPNFKGNIYKIISNEGTSEGVLGNVFERRWNISLSSSSYFTQQTIDIDASRPSLGHSSSIYSDVVGSDGEMHNTPMNATFRIYRRMA